MKRFLVTGCSGYIGSHMCYELRRAYPNCYITGIDEHRQSDNLKGLTNQFHFMTLGNSDMGFGGPFDCVFHFAAYASVPEGEQRPYAYYKNNIQSTIDIMDMAIMAKANAFVFSSTCAVYDSINSFGVPMSEEWATRPISTYAKTKKICEDILQSQRVIPTAILRYFNAAGRNQKADLRENHNPETHLIPILHKNQNIKVFGTDYDTPDGSAVRDYMHVVDICKAHVNAYEHIIAKQCNIICNLGTGKGTSVLELIKMCSEIYNKDYTVEHCDRRLGDVPYLVADNLFMRKVLQFTPQYDIVDIIKSMK